MTMQWRRAYYRVNSSVVAVIGEYNHRDTPHAYAGAKGHRGTITYEDRPTQW